MREVLEERLKARDDITVGPWKEGHHLICVNFQGKEIAHFQAEDVLDIRLTSKFIKEKALSRAQCALHHPDRSENSRWICVPFKTKTDIENIMELVDYACEVRG